MIKEIKENFRKTTFGCWLLYLATAMVPVNIVNLLNGGLWHEVHWIASLLGQLIAGVICILCFVGWAHGFKTMKSLLRCRRGSAAFMTVVAMIPLIGVFALGAEAGTWYATKQHAQNAADAAAMSGAMRLICTKNEQRGIPCNDPMSVEDRAKQLAALNGFCNTGDDGCSTPLNISQSVRIDTSDDRVRATIRQQQPAYLATVLNVSSVNIGATAVAQIDVLTKPCILALNGSVSFQGSVTVSSQNCGIASNSADPNAFDFRGNNGLNVNAPSYATGGCSQTGGNQCDNVRTHSNQVPDPLRAFDAAMNSVTINSFSGQCGSTLQPYTTATPCFNAGSQTLSGTLTSGTYFFNGAVSIGSVSGTVNLILFGSNATLSKTTGNPTINLTGKSDPQVPSSLSSVRDLMTDLVLYDPETTKKNTNVDIGGTSSIVFNGTVYAPRATVAYGGNSSSTSSSCFQLIAAAVMLSGNTQLDDSKCTSDGAATPQVFFARLVE